MVLGFWLESAVQNDDLFTSLKAQKKKKKKPKTAQRKPSQEVGGQAAVPFEPEGLRRADRCRRQRCASRGFKEAGRGGRVPLSS